MNSSYLPRQQPILFCRIYFVSVIDFILQENIHYTVSLKNQVFAELIPRLAQCRLVGPSSRLLLFALLYLRGIHTGRPTSVDLGLIYLLVFSARCFSSFLYQFIDGNLIQFHFDISFLLFLSLIFLCIRKKIYICNCIM